MIAPIFKIIMGTKFAETVMAKHTAVAKSEMVCLQNEFDMLIMKSKMETPSIDKLRKTLRKTDFVLCNDTYIMSYSYTMWKYLNGSNCLSSNNINSH